MSQERNHPVTMDVTGRVLSLEQRVKGLQGRIAAIEARLSGASGETCSSHPPDDLDFIPAAVQGHSGPGPVMPEVRLPAVENVRAGVSPISKSFKDVTGIVTGLFLFGFGILLYTGNTDLLKNPWLSMGAGTILVLLSTIGSIRFSRRSKE